MTTNALEQARTAFLQGTAAFAEQRFDDAAQAFSHALALSPGRPSVVLNLGVTRLHQGQPAAALPLLEAATAALPDAADAWSALALAHHQLERWADSSRSHAHALALGADSAALRLRLAESLSRQGLGTAAIEHYEKALEADDTLVEAWSALGDVLRESGHLARAADCYQRALDLGADPALHQYYLAALRPEAALVEAPRTYVQALFDSYAHDFEDHLVGHLGYQGHRVLIEQLPPGCPGYVARVLDLGCGTGLCGPLLRPLARRLVGVDLSAGMLRHARQAGCYDELVQADVATHLHGTADRPDAIVAADVFIYIGDLDAVLAGVRRVLKPSGLLAFSVETADDTVDFELRPSSRYAQSAHYVKTLAQRHGLVVEQQEETTLRLDQREPVAGLLFLLRAI